MSQSEDNSITRFDPTILQDYVLLEHVKSREASILTLAAQLTNSEQKVAWLLKAVTFIDLTTLGGDDTRCNVTRLCLKARSPILPTILKDLGLANDPEFLIRTAAVCVYPSRIRDAVDALRGPADDFPVLPVAAVATGFPSGQYPLKSRLSEIEQAVADGATEIDIVIDRSLVICGKWEQLFDELVAMKKACGKAHMKSILAVGELPTLSDVYKASLIAMYAGSEFIKTSTGKETVNATIPVGVVMARAIRYFHALTGRKVGLKAAGGLKTAQDAINWLVLVQEELGRDWLEKDLFRIGASSLLGAIETEIYKLVYGHAPEPSLLQLG